MLSEASVLGGVKLHINPNLLSQPDIAAQHDHFRSRLQGNLPRIVESDCFRQGVTASLNHDVELLPAQYVESLGARKVGDEYLGQPLA